MLKRRPQPEPVSAAGPIAFLFILAVLSYIVPGIVITSGVGKYQGVEQSMAYDYLGAANRYTAQGSRRIFYIARKIRSFERVPNSCATDGNDGYSDYVMRLRLFTFFGIPYNTLTITCMGEHIEG